MDPEDSDLLSIETFAINTFLLRELCPNLFTKSLEMRLLTIERRKLTEMNRNVDENFLNCQRLAWDTKNDAN